MASLLMMALFVVWGNAQAGVNVILYDTDGSALACDGDILRLNDTELQIENASCFANVTRDSSATGNVISFYDGKFDDDNVSVRKCGYDRAMMFSGDTIYISVDCGIADDGVTAYADEAQDEDGDGLHNLYEFMIGTHPSDPDTDGDYLSDGEEDADGDGLTNLEEYELGSHPLEIDTDGDGIPDFYDFEPLFIADNWCDPGEDNIVLSNLTYITDGNTCQANGSIMTGRNVSVGDMDYNGGVNFIAGESIRLFPGFQVFDGSSFSARIDPSLKP